MLYRSWYTAFITPCTGRVVLVVPGGFPVSASSPQPKLTPMQQKFVDAYCGTARFNASEAARLAGYSPKSAAKQGHDLKNTPHIRARIDAFLEENTLSAPEVLRELTDVGMRRLDEFVEITRYDKDGEPIAARMDATAKMKALELIGKSHLLFTDRVQHSGSVTVPITTVEVVLDPVDEDSAS